MMQHAILEYLANALWQVPLLATAAWLVVRITQPRAAIQYWIWIAVLVAAVSFPAARVNATPANPLADAPLTRAAIAASPQTTTPVNRSQHRAFWPALPSAIQPIHLGPRTTRAIVALYGFAILFSLYRLTFSFYAARRLVRDARATTLPADVSSDLIALADAHHILIPSVRESSQLIGPVAIGTTLPSILLPENFFSHSAPEIKAALWHEMAHLRRRDYLVNLLCRIISVPIDWHPATHAMHQRIRSSRELACDAMAAGELQSPTDYATCLVGLAQSMLPDSRHPRTHSALGLFDNNKFEERIMQLIATKSPRSTRSRIVRTALAAAILSVAFAATTLFHVTPTWAQESQQSAATAQVPPTPPTPPSPPSPSAEPPAPPAAPAPPTPPQEPVVTSDSESAATPVIEADSGNGAYTHTWTGANGRKYSFANDDPAEPTAQQKQKIEQQVGDAEQKVHAMQGQLDKLNTDEMQKTLSQVHSQLAAIDTAKMQAEIEAANHAMEAAQKIDMVKMQAEVDKAMKLSKAEIAKQMAEVQREMEKLKSGEMQRSMEEAQKAMDDAQKAMQQEHDAIKDGADKNAAPLAAPTPDNPAPNPVTQM
jgi:beta-lactamase regulating signal transducer with metallopeptidase domain